MFGKEVPMTTGQTDSRSDPNAGLQGPRAFSPDSKQVASASPRHPKNAVAELAPARLSFDESVTDAGTTRLESRFPLSFSWFPVVAGCSVTLAGVLVFIGWQFEIATLRAELPGIAPIQPGIAVFLVLGGLALAFLAKRHASRSCQVLGIICASLVAAWGTLHLFEYLYTGIFGPRDLAFSSLASLSDLPFKGSTSIWAALPICLLGFAPLFLNTRRHHWFGESLIVLPLSITFLGLVSEAFRVATVSGPAADRPSSLPAVLVFLLLELGYLWARKDRGWMGILTGYSLGGSLARRLLPFAILVPFGLAWLRVVAEQANVLKPDMGSVLYALSIIFVQSFLILLYAVAVNRTDRERKEAEAFVRNLLRTGARLNSTLDLETLLTILVNEAIRLVNAESGMAGLRTVEGMASPRYLLRGKSISAQEHWRPGEGLPGWIAEHKVSYRSNEASTDPLIDQHLCARFDVRSVLSTPILDARGNVLGFFEVHNKREGGFTDEDERRLSAVAQSAASAIQNALAYRQLREAEKALKEADRHKDEFLAILAHELRNPLAPLRNGLQIVRLATHDADAVNQASTIMERQLGHMVRLVDDLLDMSRISRGKVELRMTRVEMATVIQQAIETSRPIIEQAGHDLKIEVPCEPILVEADVTRLTQVFANLLNNAAKFTEPGGQIRLSVERHSTEAVVKVRDNGMGIPVHMLPKVFEVFTQVEQSLERAQGGLGIGLSLVRGLVELHGGSVEAKSQGDGMGSEFTVRLPVVQSHTEVHSTEVPADPPTLRRRILVVDDNRDSATSLAMMLTIMGNETQTAHDGEEGLNVAAEFRPEVVLMDIGMPKMNGYDAARRIRTESWGQEIILVAVTGWGQDDDRRRSREAGFDHHIVKPVEPAALVQILNAFSVPKTPALE